MLLVKSVVISHRIKTAYLKYYYKEDEITVEMLLDKSVVL